MTVLADKDVLFDFFHSPFKTVFVKIFQKRNNIKSRVQTNVAYQHPTRARAFFAYPTCLALNRHGRQWVSITLSLLLISIVQSCWLLFINGNVSVSYKLTFPCDFSTCLA